MAAVVLDANVLISLCTREAATYALAQAAMDGYVRRGFTAHAPGAVVTETLHILCRMVADGRMSIAEHARAVGYFATRMEAVMPPTGGDGALILRAEQIREGYGCSRSADGLYIALAEELSSQQETELVTFDIGMVNQAARNAPTVTVRLLTA